LYILPALEPSFVTLPTIEAAWLGYPQSIAAITVKLLTRLISTYSSIALSKLASSSGWVVTIAYDFALGMRRKKSCRIYVVTLTVLFKYSPVRCQRAPTKTLIVNGCCGLDQIQENRCFVGANGTNTVLR
jgi:hypothetical protein